MRFTEFPDDEVEMNHGRRVEFRGPEGSGIGSLPTMVRASNHTGYEDDGLPAVTARVVFDADDLALLADGMPLYITMYGGCIPISVDIPAERVVIPDGPSALAGPGRKPTADDVGGLIDRDAFRTMRR